MIAIKHKTFELDKLGWIAVLMDARKRKEHVLSQNLLEKRKRRLHGYMVCRCIITDYCWILT